MQSILKTNEHLNTTRTDLVFMYNLVTFFNVITAAVIKAKKGKVFYGQEPPSGESTATECGFNYQLLAIIYGSSRIGAP